MLSRRDLVGSSLRSYSVQGRSRQSGSEKDREMLVGKDFRDVEI